MHDSSSLCCFAHHPTFIEELNEFITKYGTADASVDETVRYLENLFETHFYKKIPTFTAKHLGQAQGFNGFTVFWVHMVIPNCNLSRTQYPKAYFYKTDNHLSFLCLDSHLQNYKDAKLRATAIGRLEEMVEVLKTH